MGIITPAGVLLRNIEFDVNLFPGNTRKVLSDIIAEKGYETHLLTPEGITVVEPTHMREEEGGGRHYLVSHPEEQSLHYVGFLRDANMAKEVCNTAICYFRKRTAQTPFSWNDDGDPIMVEGQWLSTFQLKARWVRDEAPGLSHMRRDKMELLVEGPNSWLIEASYAGLRGYIRLCKESDHPTP